MVLMMMMMMMMMMMIMIFKLIILDLFFVGDTVDGRNPAPPGM